MITTFAMGLALLAPQAPVGRWGKGALTPEALARRVDARLASLSKATLKYYYTFDKQAASGTAFGWFNATVVDGKRFRIELPHFDPTKAAVRGQ